MIYLIKSDLEHIFIKRKAWLLFYFITIFCFPILWNFNGLPITDIFFINVGMKFDDVSILTILLYLFHFSFYIFICLDVILGNLKIGVDNVFLRLNKSKVVILKMGSCLIFTCFLSLVMFLLLPIIYYILNFSIPNLVINMFIFIISKVFIIMFIMMIIASFYDYKYYFVILLLCCVINISGYNFIQLYLFKQQLIHLVLYFIFTCIGYIFTLKHTIVKLFERSF